MQFWQFYKDQTEMWHN